MSYERRASYNKALTLLKFTPEIFGMVTNYSNSNNLSLVETIEYMLKNYKPFLKWRKSHEKDENSSFVYDDFVSYCKDNGIKIYKGLEFAVREVLVN